MDNKNDIFADSYLLNFNILAPEMTIPDLLTPGINDKICKKPIKIDIPPNSFTQMQLYTGTYE